MRMKWSSLVVIGAVASPGFAGGAGTYSVEGVGCIPNGHCYVMISPAVTNTTCVKRDQIRFDITLPGSGAQYSAALAALASGKTISANLTDDCLDDFPIPHWFHINK